MSEHPLHGQRIVVTRAAHQAAELIAPLQALGATVLALPTIEIAPPLDQYAALDKAIARLDQFDWIVFTSVNAVAHFWARLAYANKTTDALNHARIAAIGTATAAALRERGVTVQLLPADFVAESLLTALESQHISGQSFLLPRADIARPLLHEGLVAAGALVTEVHAYRTLTPQWDAAAWADLAAGVDVLTFTSSSTVRNFVARVGAERARALAERAQVAVIGPITAQTAAELGLRVTIEAETYTMAGLVAAIVTSGSNPTREAQVL